MTPSTRATSLAPVLILASLLPAGAVVPLAAPAAAASSAQGRRCDAVVVDRAHVLRDPAVRRAARALTDQAADVRVRSYTGVPHGNLDRAVEDFVASLKAATRHTTPIIPR